MQFLYLENFFLLFSSEIRDLLANPNDLSKRVPHRRLAEEATLLVHGMLV